MHEGNSELSILQKTKESEVIMVLFSIYLPILDAAVLFSSVFVLVTGTGTGTDTPSIK